jgi:hypothetical protein
MPYDLDSEVDNAIKSVMGDNREAYQRSMQIAATRNPEEHAQVLNVAKTIDVPPSAITKNNFEIAKKKADESRNVFEDLAGSNPITTKWLSNPDNSSIAKDEVDSLRKFENTVHERSFSENLFNTISSGMAQFNSSLASIPDAVYNVAALPQNLAIKLFDLPYKPVSSGDVWENKGVKFFEDNRKSLAAQVDWFDINIEKAIEDGDAKKLSKYFAAQVIANAPSQIFTLVSAYGGMTKMAMSVLGTATAGQSMIESQERGVDPVTGTVAGVAKGSAEALFESLGTFGLFKKWENKMFQSLGSASYKQIVRDAGQTLAYSFMGEFNEEMQTSFIQDFTDYATGNNPAALDGMLLRGLEAGVVGGLSGSTMTAPAAFMASVQRRLNTVKSEESRDGFISMGEQLGEMKLTQRSKEKAAEFVDSVVAGSAAENVYIEPEKLQEYFEKNGQDSVQVMKGLGILEKWNAAKESGSAMEIKTADILANFSGSELVKQIADDIKFDPDSYSVNEMSEQNKEAEDLYKKMQEEMAEQAYQQDEELKQKFNEVAANNRAIIRNNISTQLQSLKGYTKKRADTEALLYEKFFGTLEERYGIDAGQLFGEYAPLITEGTFEIPKKLKVPKLKEGTDFINKIIETVNPKAKEEFDAEKAANDILENEMKIGPKMNIDKEGNIIPDLAVLMQIRSDINIGSGESTMVLKRDKAGRVITGMSTATPAPDYITNSKGERSYEKLLEEVNEIIFKVVNNKKLNKYNQRFLSAYYKDAYEFLNNAWMSSKSTDELFEKVIKKDVTSNENFANWFKGSKIVDESGNPLIVYHGTSKNFSEFSKNKSGTNTANYGMYGNAAGYFTSNIDIANAYAVGNPEQSIFTGREGEITFSDGVRNGANVMPVYLSIKNPLKVKSHSEVEKIIRKVSGSGKIGSKAVSVALKAIGYDGVIVNDGEEIIAFEPEQIKSAIGNNGLYDKNNKNILFEQVKETIAGSYTPSSRLIKIAESATFSTFLHESGHYFFDVIESMVKSGNAPEGLVKDYNIIREYVGAQEGKELTVDQQEKFADAFVNYLGTGKSPSKALRRAFETFKNWLFTVFGGVRLYPELNPEITAVFDRMLASDVEMQRLADELTPIDFSSEFAADELQRYAELLPEVRLEAADIMIERELARQNKKLAKEYKDKEKQVREQVEKEADDIPAIQVIDRIKTDEYIDRLNRDDVAQLGTKFLESFPPELMKKGGSQAQVISDEYGFRDMFTMLKEISKYRSREQFVEQETNRRMVELYPELHQRSELSEDAQIALRNENREKLLEMEANMLAKKAYPVIKGIAKKLIQRVPQRKAIAAAAVFTIQKMKLTDIKPHIYRRAEVKFAKEAAKAFGKGDFVAALQAKEKERLNFELHNAAMAALKQIEKDKKLFKKFKNKDEDIVKKRELNYVNVGRALLNMYGISVRPKKTVADYVSAIQKFDKDFYESVSLLVEPIQMAAKPIENTTFEEYSALSNMMQDLWDMAAEVKAIEIEGKKISIEEVSNILVPQFKAVTPPTDKKKVLTPEERKDQQKEADSKNTKSSYRRLESWVNGVTTYGMKAKISDAAKFLFRPISESDTKMRAKINEVQKELQSIVDANMAWFQDPKGFVSDELGYHFSRSELFVALLHSGNESNLRKLIVGRGWGLIEDGALDRSKFDAAMARARKEGVLTKDIYEMAQKIWNLMEKLNVDTQKAHKKVKGYYYGKVIATPFENEFGKYEGGYIPAVVDPKEIKDLKQQKEAMERLEKNEGYQYPSKSMDSGFSKDRNENYYGPLSLDFALVPGHIDKVIKFTYIEPARKQLQMLIKDDKLMAAINDFDDSAIMHIIEPFLHRAQEQKIIIPEGNNAADKRALSRFASYARNSATIQIMTGLASSALQQYTGFVVAKTKFIGDQKGHLSTAAYDYFLAGKKSKMTQDAADMSEWFKAEMVNNNFEVAKEVERIVFNKDDLTKAQEWAKKNAYWLQKATQNQVNTIVWHAAYNQYYEQNPNGSQKDAVYYADSMVRTTQGTNNPVDVSQSQVVTPLQSLIYQFTGYFNMVYNLKQEQFEKVEREIGFNGLKSDPKDVRYRKFLVYAYASAIPSILVAQLLRTLAGRPFDADGDGELSFYDLMVALGFPMISAEVAMFPTHPLIKQGVQVAINKFNSIPVDDRIQSPAYATIEKAAAAPAELADFLEGKGSRKRAVADTLTLIGFVTQLPTAPLAKPINYLTDVNEGKANPKGPIDFTRGLITGQPGE